MAAGMKEISRETITELKAKPQALPKELEVQHMPPVVKYTELFLERVEELALVAGTR